MFDPLDPPEDFRPDESFRAETRRRGVRRRRRQRLVVTGLGTVMVLVVVAGAATAYTRNRWDRVQRVTVASLPTTPVASDQPFNLLVVGNDSGVVPGQTSYRTDSIAVLHVDPGAGKVQALSIPRDLWVTLAGTGRQGRINESIQSGPEELVETIRTALGISVDHVVMMDFTGFEKLVDSVGGIRVDFPEPVRAAHSTSFAAPAGCDTLNGDQALAFARARKDFEILKDGYWHVDLSGDLGRIARQQTVALAFLAAFHRSADNPVSQLRLLNSLLDHVTIDSRFTSHEMAGLVADFHALKPDDVTFTVVPVLDTVIGGADVLVMPPNSAAVDAALSPFRPDPNAKPNASPAALEKAITDLQDQLDTLNSSEANVRLQLANATGNPTLQLELANQLLGLEKADQAERDTINAQITALQTQVALHQAEQSGRGVVAGPDPAFVFSAC